VAKPTKFVQACRTIERAIDAATKTGTGSHKTRAAMMTELGLWASTFYSGDSFPRISKLKLPWSRWDQELYMAGLLVAVALRLHALENISLTKARFYARAPDADIREVDKLIKKAGLSIHDVVRSQHPDVESRLAAVRERLDVRLEPRALEDMLLASAEGYMVSPGKGRRYTEVFGLCFGSVRRKTVEKVAKAVYVNVSRVATQIRAKATASSVLPNAGSLASQLHIGNQFFPHLELVGDYHTHPYPSLTELNASRGWEYSDQDESALPAHIKDVRGHNHADPLFSLVVAVARGGKASTSSRRKAPNVVHISVGDLFFVIGAYRILLDGSYDRKVQLSVSASM